MVAHRAQFLVIPVFVAIAAAAGCDRAPARGPSGVTTTSGPMRPEARPSSARTVDNAGFIDNAGRSSSERGRTEMSGMRGTETGSEQPTGTPGTGFPLPIEPGAPRGTEADREKGADRQATSGAPTESVVGRVAQALCDYEMSCERIGKGKASPSLASCIAKARIDARADLAASTCPESFETNAVSRCLGALRHAACEKHVSHLTAMKECEPRALCAPH